MNFAHAVYRQSLPAVVFFSVMLSLCWVTVNCGKRRRWVKRLVNLLGWGIAVFAVFAFTVLSRNGGQGIILTPFHFLERAKEQPELYRSFYMNIFLFVPLGVFMPYALSNKPRLWPVFVTVAFGIALSVGVEYLQYRYSRGLSETDDVIANTLGTVIGTASYCLYVHVCKKEREIAINQKLTAGQRVLLDCVAHAYFGKPAGLPQTVDVDGLLAMATEQAVFPAVYLTLQENRLTDRPTDKRFDRQILRNSVIESAHVELGSLLQSHGIACTVIKGVASAACYPEPMLRSAGDVDIFVAEAELPRADALLQSAGFFAWDDISVAEKHYRYTRGEGRQRIVCELHRCVTDVPANAQGAAAEKYLADILEKTRSVTTACGECRVPSEFHHGLILLMHTARHMVNEGVGLRHLCDWAVFVSRFSDEAFTELFETPLKEIGLWRFAQALTRCCICWLGCPPKAWAEADEALTQSLMGDILDGGNFGRSNVDRYRQIKYVTDREKNTVSESASRWQVFRSIHAKTKAEHPFFRKHPALLPAGWAVTVGQYLWLLATGKRRADSLKTVKTAQARKALYGELALYKDEEKGEA